MDFFQIFLLGSKFCLELKELGVGAGNDSFHPLNGSVIADVIDFSQIILVGFYQCQKNFWGIFRVFTGFEIED